MRAQKITFGEFENYLNEALYSQMHACKNTTSTTVCEQVKDFFKMADTNADGKINLSETQNFGLTEDWFNRMNILK